MTESRSSISVYGLSFTLVNPVAFLIHMVMQSLSCVATFFRTTEQAEHQRSYGNGEPAEPDDRLGRGESFKTRKRLGDQMVRRNIKIQLKIRK